MKFTAKSPKDYIRPRTLTVQAGRQGAALKDAAGFSPPHFFARTGITVTLLFLLLSWFFLISGCKSCAGKDSGRSGEAEQERQRAAAREMQKEARINLAAIYQLERAYQGSHQTYAENFLLLDWSPEGPTRYAYFIGRDEIQPDLGGPFRRPTEPLPAVSRDQFTAIAVANIDQDPALDVWIINHQNELINLADDIEP